MPEEGRNGLSLSGERRLERVEMQAQRLTELVGGLGNKVDLMLERQDGITRRLDRHDRDHERDAIAHQAHVDEHEKRHRGLDFRVYGALTALGLAAAYVINQRGVPTIP